MRPVLLLLVCCLIIIAVAVLGAIRFSEVRLRADAEIDLASERRLISNNVDALRHLPVAVAHHPYVIASLSDTQASHLSSSQPYDLQVNQYLQTVSKAAGASLLYVIDVDGLTRGANNWNTAESLVGNYYTFRPYFQNAIVGNEARYYAVGVTTGEAGYYFGQPVRNENQIVGVAVLKLELESLQEQWQQKKPHSLLIDDEGIIIVSSNPQWRYQATRALSEQDLERYQKQQKYANHALRLLDTRGSFDDRRIRIDGQTYLNSKASLPLQQWTLVQLTPVTTIYNTGIITALFSALLASLSIALFLYRRERLRKIALSQAASDAEKTRALNLELTDQINERRKAQANLKEAQLELIQASKLAALGQMSAAIAHEVNQPLSAIRTFSASTKLLLERDRLDEAHQNLNEIQALTERLAVLTYDLKTFARKSEVPREPVSLQDCVHRVVTTLESDLEYGELIVKLDMPESEVSVWGNAVRVEQVLSNLLRNAMDATSELSDAGNVSLNVSKEQDFAIVRVQDNGPGMRDTDIAHVFEPFFTTKPMGQGVGLGLSISYGIVEEMGGQLRVRNADEGGALFTVKLPCHQEASL